MPASVYFSASSLQDYVICPRRFQLRYVLRLAWPSSETAKPAEQEEHVQLGRDLHRLIHQHLLGMPVERLSVMIHHSRLQRWWQAYLTFASHLCSMRLLPELTLSVPLAGQRVVARFDAVAVADQLNVSLARVLILDWKTYHRRPSREWLAARLQSRVYPVVLLKAGGALLGTSSPSDLEMCYWFAEHPLNPERFRYSETTYHADIAYLQGLIAEIMHQIEATSSIDTTEQGWRLTEDESVCCYCVYRSLCRREAASTLEDYLPDDIALHDDTPYEMDWGPEGIQTLETVF